MKTTQLHELLTTCTRNGVHNWCIRLFLILISIRDRTQNQNTRVTVINLYTHDDTRH